MRSMNLEIIRDAQEFTARWGFLTRDLFYEFICGMRPTQNYRYWNYLTERGHFVKSNANPLVILLSHRSRRTLFGRAARPSRLPAYIEHDSAAAQFLLTLQRYKLIERYWLEDELMRNPLSSYDVLGADRIRRLPDLVFDLRAEGEIIRCALEIERTVKPQSRYDKIAMSYVGYSKLSLVLFGCNGGATAAAVGRAFQGNTLAQNRIIPGLFQIDEFKHKGIESHIRFQAREHTIKNFIELVTKKCLERPDSKRSLKGKLISFRKADFKVSA